MADGIRYTVSVTVNQAELDQFLTDHNGPLGRFGQNFATQITRTAKSKAPVITGVLRDSLSTRTVGGGGQELGWEITGVDYLEYVTEGNPGQPNPFIEEAAAEVAARFF